ncbi:hypothetical protein FA95DRAFT_967456 [Auriscalpium vulgare]|uniref:Uncharacterized protein n=1 Tax=Auriscalpium vulgare TaxID=40419 RepID=A0ACB8R7N0_9AGAM|nr:hypothetical protein FA95DRAFT_967456 [Auriscalpium vulgare]
MVRFRCAIDTSLSGCPYGFSSSRTRRTLTRALSLACSFSPPSPVSPCPSSSVAHLLLTTPGPYAVCGSDVANDSSCSPSAVPASHGSPNVTFSSAQLVPMFRRVASSVTDVESSSVASSSRVRLEDMPVRPVLRWACPGPLPLRNRNL